MKNIKNTCIAACISLLIISCNLEEIIYDSADSESFIKTEADIPYVLNGVYSCLTSYDCYKSSFNNQILYGADDFASVYIGYRPFLERTVSTTEKSFNGPWKSFYTMINNANSLMESLEMMQNISDDYKNRISGELYFLRAFTYFNLVRLYGGVPIHTSSSNGQSDFYPKRSTIEEVYSLIFDDFKKASETCLPFSKQPSSEFGRATKGAAQSMLSLAYLTYGNYYDLKNERQEAEKYYQLAENYADSVILSNEYQLLPYADLWNVANEKKAYKEVIFGIPFTRDATASEGSSRGSELASFYQPSTRNDICGNINNGVGYGLARVQPWFFDLYNTGDYVNDYRSEVSFLTSWKNTLTNKSYITYPRIPSAGETIDLFPYLDKYKDPDGLDIRNHENDFYIIRLSEIYLIKAEAENELHGPTTEAYTAFNQLRERARYANGIVRSTPANLIPDLTKEDFRMRIFNERGLELIGEGHRWFDSVRMKYKDNNRTMIQYRYEDFFLSMPMSYPTYNSTTKAWGGGRVNPLNVVKFSEKFLIWPIPSVEIDTNPNITQNQGW